ncbi:hypothetical protein FKW77_006069 [Venturia effusa]|uniref:Peptide hydrolase n=1 Tax=Venturia effusa TaxID=50376 RepID=A0A517LP38_9PEZI|nr:hypothetical protein FKW77_006069 [Venturia effusa]
MAGLRSMCLAALAAYSATASPLQDPTPIIPPVPGPTSPSSSLQKPIIDTKALQATIQSENLLARAKTLSQIAKLSEDEYGHPTRVIGSAGHIETMNWIYKTIADLGDYYTISNQSFPSVTGIFYESRLELGGEVPESAIPMFLSPPTKNLEPVKGQVVLVANSGCDISDFPKNITNAVALIKRGTCSFLAKSENAGKSGAIAAVVYNNVKESFGGNFGEKSPNYVPTWGISLVDALPLIEKLTKGISVDATAYMNSKVKDITTTNIIAQTTGGDQNNCVMLGAHHDSRWRGPGINDDGSGTISLLEIATQLTNFTVNNCVRFAWMSAEEEGLVGSTYYVNHLTMEENKKIRMFMDYDMMASPNYAYQIYNATNADNPDGTEQIRDLYINWFKEQGLNYTLEVFDGRSDYVSFINAGIPAGGILTGQDNIKTEEEVAMFGGQAGVAYDQCYHQLCDDVENLNMTAWPVTTKLIAHGVATYARSLEGFPPVTRNPTTVIRPTADEKNVKRRGKRSLI